MGELNIQIKVLKRSSPVLFSWWNKEIGATEGCLVFCPCQDLDLSEGPGSSKKEKITGVSLQDTAHASWAVMLGQALQRAEILTIPVEAESSGIFPYESTDISLVGDSPEHFEEHLVGGRAPEKRDRADGKPGKSTRNVGGASVKRTDSIFSQVLSARLTIKSSEHAKDEGSGNDQGGKHLRDPAQNAANEDLTVGEESSSTTVDNDTKEEEGSYQTGEDRSDVGNGDIRGGTEIVVAQRDKFSPGKQARLTTHSEVIGIRKVEAQVSNLSCQIEASDHGGAVTVEGGSREASLGATTSSWMETKSSGMPGISESQQEVRALHISNAGEIPNSQTLTIDESACHVTDRNDSGNLLGGQVMEDSHFSSHPQLAGTVKQGSSSFSVSTHSLPEEKVLTPPIGSQLISLGTVTPDSVVVLQDGQEQASEVDRALLEVLKGLLKPQMQVQPQGTEDSEIRTDHRGGQVAELEGMPTAPVDPVCTINTPAMMRYREHKTQLYLKKLHQSMEGSRAGDMTICEVCGSIISVRQLRRHMKCVHSTTKPKENHQCSTCGKQFHKSDSLARHERTHTEPTFHCNQCNKSFRHNFQLQNHRKLHAGYELPKRVHKPRYKTSNPKPRRVATGNGNCGLNVVECPVCNTKIGAKSLVRHLKMKHSDVSWGRFNCEECDEKFTTKTRLHTHALTHRGLKFHCGFCSIVLADDLKRVRHERTHPCEPSKMRFKCGFCPKTYSRVRDRLRHEMAHFDPTIDLSHGTRNKPHPAVNKPVQCPQCNKTLKQNSMRAHMDSHRGKTWTCQVCGKTISKGARYDHLKLHSGSKQHRCTICPSSFFTKHALLAHLRTHTQEKSVACRYCDRKFARYEGRNNHEREHTGERPYRCEECGKAWKDRPSYAQHMKRYHPGKPLMERKRRGAALLPRLPGVPVE